MQRDIWKINIILMAHINLRICNYNKDISFKWFIHT